VSLADFTGISSNLSNLYTKEKRRKKKKKKKKQKNKRRKKENAEKRKKKYDQDTHSKIFIIEYVVEWIFYLASVN
jgi:hypothetical protein